MANKILSGNIITDFSDFRFFRDDVSIQNFNNHYKDVNEKFNDFYFKLEGCVERHAPLKKLTPKEINLKTKHGSRQNLIK